jgi:hypothetical protein
VRPCGRIAFCLFVAASVGACTEVVDSTTEIRYGQYNYTTDWAKNEAILLNVVRASKFQPLNFLVYQTYTGTATASAQVASPGFIIGPQRSASQKQFTFSNSTLNATGTGTGSISVQNLDTQDFYDALLSPVDFKNLYAFQRQGYPRELLFRLFTDYVSLKRPIDQDPQGRNAVIIYNDPEPTKQCFSRSIEQMICFGDLVRFALLSGLSSEIRTGAAPASSSSKPAGGGGGAKTGAGTTPSSSSSSSASSSSGSSAPTTEARLCFDGALANNARIEFRDHPPPDWYPRLGMNRFLYGVSMANYHPICGGTSGLDAWPGKGSASGPTSNQSAGTNTLYVAVTVPTGEFIWDLHRTQHNTVEIGTRSTFAIYNFLGRLMNYQDDPINRLVSPPNDVGDRYVLTVYKKPPAGCFVWTTLDLGVYCVPVDGAENTKRTFSILSQLLALKTTTGDLQLQPIFRLQPQ